MISNLNMYTQANLNIQSISNEINTIANQIATGEKQNLDPISNYKKQGLTYNISINEQYLKNSEHAKTKITLNLNILNTIQEKILSIRDLSLITNNTTSSITSAQISSLSKEIESLLNSKDSFSNYIFSGFSNTQPFINGSYQGDQGQIYINTQQNNKIKTNITGEEIINNNFFPDISSIINNINTNQPIQSGILNNYIDNINNVIAEQGTLVNQLSSSKELTTSINNNYYDSLEKISKSDPISDFILLNKLKTTQEALLKSYSVMFNTPNLFSYLA